MLELDASNKQTWQLSNDAFYLLYCGEEPLDEDNRDEANEIAAMFPHGFFIESYEVVGEDLIEAVFIPYKPSDFKVEYFCKMTNEVELQVHYTSSNQVRYRFLHDSKGTIMEGEVPVFIDRFSNKPCFKTTGGSVIPIWTLSKK